MEYTKQELHDIVGKINESPKDLTERDTEILREVVQDLTERDLEIIREVTVRGGWLRLDSLARERAYLRKEVIIMWKCVNNSGQTIATFLVCYHAARWVLAHPIEMCLVYPYYEFSPDGCVWFPNISGEK